VDYLVFRDSRFVFGVVITMQDTRETISIGSFGSAHSGGANFVLADGSVHKISYTIDATIYRYLGNRRDGQMAEVPQ